MSRINRLPHEKNVRGIMACIPVDQDRRNKAISALSLLRSGKWLNRQTLFSVHVSDQRERCWQKALLKRMILDGSVKAIGNSKSRIYSILNYEKLSLYESLLNERDEVVRKWGYGNTFQMTSPLKEILDGVILGDGHYENTGNLSSALTLGQREDRLTWLESLEIHLKKYGIESSVQPGKIRAGTLPNGRTLQGRPNFFLRTRFYRTLKDERNRWYKNRVKIIPRDLDISSPITLANWYMGDGCVSENTVTLSTHCFSENDVSWLRDEMSRKLKIHVSINHWRGLPVLCISNRNAYDFINIVQPHIESCFGYKVKNLKWKHPVCVKCGSLIPGMTAGAKYCAACVTSRIMRGRNKAYPSQGLVKKHAD